jgi:hypothetical protein
MKKIIISIIIIVLSINCKSINNKNDKDFKETEKIKNDTKDNLERETKDYNNDYDDDRENQNN